MSLNLKSGATALLVMDCQNDLVHEEGKIALATGLGGKLAEKGVRETIGRVLDAARAAGVLVVHVVIDFDRLESGEMPRRGGFFRNVSEMLPALGKGTWGGQIHERFEPLEGEPVVGKCIVSGFARSDLREILVNHGTRDVILTGVATEMVVESTARDAVDVGFDVVTVRDGVASFDDEAHAASLLMLDALGDVALAQDVVASMTS